MNNLIKTVVNFKNRINANPFSIVHAKFGNLEADISDFFTFRLDGYETIFIAENNLALLTGRIMNCRHIFHFFDKNGNPCSIYKVESEELHYKLSIKDKMTGSTEFGGFTHHIQYDDETLKQHKALLADISFQHRGYSGFRKNLTNGFSYVHGNFGGMYIDKQQNIQSLAFLLIDSHSTKPLKKICLDSHATYKFTLHELDIKNDCNISWETNLPVGRCVVFEYSEKYFDVFHS